MDVEVENLLARFLLDMFEIGVTMLRIDAAAHVYPSSLARIVEPFPWDYIFQEIYAAPLYAEPKTKQYALMIGSITDFAYGQFVTQMIIDKFDGDGGKSRNKAFEDLLYLNQTLPSWMGYALSDTVVPESQATLFLDNHDQQRARWKHSSQLNDGSDRDDHTAVTPTCHYDGKSVNECRLTYKNGREYLLATLYMLAYPYGDTVRVMSSFAFDANWERGPPGIQPDSLEGTILPVHTDSGLRCRPTPDSSPVTIEYDDDTELPWVCEHRWKGVAGLVRFRKLVKNDLPISLRFSDDNGHVAFGLGDVAFVAMNRGWNWFTQAGSNQTWSLADSNIKTSLPPGSYCDLAQASNPIGTHWRCGSNAIVVVKADGTITAGSVASGGLLAIHTNYASRGTETEVVV